MKGQELTSLFQTVEKLLSSILDLKKKKRIILICEICKAAPVKVFQ